MDGEGDLGGGGGGLLHLHPTEVRGGGGGSNVAMFPKGFLEVGAVGLS